MNAKRPSTSKHTPGPWDHVAGHIHAEIRTVSGTLYPTVALVDHSTSRWEDNARLIAAAPELLEVAKKAVLDLEDCMEHSSHLPEQVRMNATASIEQARAIIAKAEGSDNV